MASQVKTAPPLDTHINLEASQGLPDFIERHHLQVAALAISENDNNLEFDDIPPFPNDVPLAPLLRISLRKLISGEKDEIDRLWEACCELGFFYLDLRDGYNVVPQGLGLPEKKELWNNVWREHVEVEQDVQENTDMSTEARHVLDEDEIGVDGDRLLKDADELFNVGEEVFRLPVEEKVKYDLKDQGSYYGYKGYGDGVIDAQGTKDRNEFYNVSKDDILGLSDRLPAPALLEPHRKLLKSYIKQCHAIVALLLRLLNARLDLPWDKLPSLHKLHAASGDQVRWVHAPPQPAGDCKTALGEHSDFGSVTILFNRLGGLQVLSPRTDSWCYVKPLKGLAVVNMGDALVKFTAGILRSNIHRVISPPGEQAEVTRMSLVYFARPEDDVVLKALEGSKMIEDKRKHRVEFKGEEITSKEWILRRALGRRQGGDWDKSGGTEGDRVSN